jgi:DtxR family transcriptional regulator, Mn-dependent transcriptional regulator
MAARALTPAAEDYLKAVYALCSHGAHAATTSELAQRLGVSSPSVSAMVGRLEDEGLVRRAEGRGVQLTPDGERAALRVVRRHRLLETFLERVLDVPWDEVHAEAERLEHHVSEELEARMDSALGHPTRDPHGDPIPGRDGTIAAVPAKRLLDLEPGEPAVVVRVSDRSPEQLRFLGELGMRPGVAVVVLERLPFEGPIRVQVEDRVHVIGRPLAAAVNVAEGAR